MKTTLYWCWFLVLLILIDSLLVYDLAINHGIGIQPSIFSELGKLGQLGVGFFIKIALVVFLFLMKDKIRWVWVFYVIWSLVYIFLIITTLLSYGDLIGCVSAGNICIFVRPFV